jgi:hypothetical protein
MSLRGDELAVAAAFLEEQRRMGLLEIARADIAAGDGGELVVRQSHVRALHVLLEMPSATCSKHPCLRSGELVVA